MSISYILIFAQGIIILGALLAVVYTFGVVWRVEKKLDLSYKLLLASIISFVLSELFSIFQFQGREWVAIAAVIFKVLFVILFLAGILEVRNMLRKLDGEKGTDLTNQ